MGKRGQKKPETACERGRARVFNLRRGWEGHSSCYPGAETGSMPCSSACDGPRGSRNRGLWLAPALCDLPTRQNGCVEHLTDEERAKRETDLTELIDLMRPAVQADGGDLELVSYDLEKGEVEVQLRGACSSCAISSATLQGGVERILKGRLDWITEVRGGVDESVDPFESVSLGRGAYVPKI